MGRGYVPGNLKVKYVLSGGGMEKHFRDFLRHLEKIDYDVISEEEVVEEREKLKIKLEEAHHEMVQILIPMTGALVCMSIFLAAGFVNMFIGSFICAGIFAIIFIWLLTGYKTLRDTERQLRTFIDKLTIQ